MIERFDPSSAGAFESIRTLMAGGIVGGLICLYTFDQESPVRALLHALKYRSLASVGTRLGGDLGLAVAERRTGADLIVPVPLSKRKERERGYNQASAVARGVSLTTSIPVAEGVLIRVRDGQSQTSLTREERKNNVLHAFSVAPSTVGRVAGKSCLLVDDVITTGATVLACAAALRVAGASEVIACSVAAASLAEAKQSHAEAQLGRQQDLSLP